MLRVRSRRAVGFIEGCLPANQPPAGPNWLHEIKHDGFHNRSGRVAHWLKIKNPAAPAVSRGADEDWGSPPDRWRSAEISVKALMALIGGMMF